MDLSKLLIIYAALAGSIFLLALFTGKNNRGYYNRLDKKEHSLRLFYPAAAFLYGLFQKATKAKPDKRLMARMRRLYVKENVAEETFLYALKKISLALMILLSVGLLGAMVCAADMQMHYIESLERNEPGRGEAAFDLNVDYDGTMETVEITLDEMQYTEEEIRQKFDACASAVRKEMLGENLSADYVSRPLHFISDYEGIHITWEIGDPSVIDYNGTITDDLDEGEKLLLEIYATFSMADVTEIFSMPVRVVSDTLSRKEKLLQTIRQSIEENNSVYDKTVELPAEVDGKKIAFAQTSDHNGYIFLVFGLLAVLLIIFGYDRNLDKLIRKRNEQMLLDFTEIVSKLTLLYEAGLSIYKAWERIVEDYEKKKRKEPHFAYQEMKLVLEKVRSGMSERQAYAEFGKRCGLHPYIKLGNVLEQNLSKGTKGMKLLLKQEVADAFEERKRIAKKRGEEANTKLLFPMILMLVIVIIIIAVPALMTMQF